MADTAQGATLAMSGGFTGLYFSIQPPSYTREDVVTHDLAETEWKTTAPEDLVSIGDATGVVYFDPNDLDALLTDIKGTTETYTITYPIPSGATAGATEAGTAYLKGIEREALVSGNPAYMMATITFRFDGETGPTATDSA